MVFTEVEIVRERRSSMEHRNSKFGLVPDHGLPEYSVDVNSDNPYRYDEPLDAIQQMRSLSKKVAENAPNPEAWLYARSAFLYYIACFIVWVRRPALSSDVPFTNIFNRPLQLLVEYTFTYTLMCLPLALFMSQSSLLLCLVLSTASCIVLLRRRNVKSSIGTYGTAPGHGMMTKRSRYRNARRRERSGIPRTAVLLG